MATTYSAMQTRVNRRVIDLPAAVQAEVPQLLNVALAKLQERHNFKVMERELAVYTAVNSHTILQSVGGSAVTIPTAPAINFKEWRGEPWFLRYQDGSPRAVTWAPSREAIWGALSNGGAISSDTGFPMVLLEEISDDTNARGISVYPLPDGNSDYSDGEYRLTLPYYAYVAVLSAAGDHNWFTDQASGEEYLVRWATAEAHALNWDFEKFQILTADAERHYNDLVRADKRYRLGSVHEFVPHWRGVHSTKTRL